MTRKFELAVRDNDAVRLTITPDRITLKVPSTLTVELKAALVDFAKQVAEIISFKHISMRGHVLVSQTELSVIMKSDSLNLSESFTKSLINDEVAAW